MNGYLLDTHSWLWVQRGDASRFSPRVRAEIEERQRRSQLFFSAISILEVARLVALNQYVLPTSVDEFVEEALTDDGLILLPLTPRILIESTRLPGNFHRDPNDRILAATARENGLTLITQDKEILRYGQRGFLNVMRPS